jgi:hypothetical protein
MFVLTLLMLQSTILIIFHITQAESEGGKVLLLLISMDGNLGITTITGSSLRLQKEGTSKHTIGVHNTCHCGTLCIYPQNSRAHQNALPYFRAHIE